MIKPFFGTSETGLLSLFLFLFRTSLMLYVSIEGNHFEGEVFADHRESKLK